jgi:hypothetical protein
MLNGQFIGERVYLSHDRTLLWRFLAQAHPTSYNKVFVRVCGIGLCERRKDAGLKARRYLNNRK